MPGPTGIEIGPPSILGRHAALQAVGRLHRDRAHAVLAEVLFDLDDDVERRRRPTSPVTRTRVVDGRQRPARELDVHDRSDDLDDLADLDCFCDCHSCVAFIVRN